MRRWGFAPFCAACPARHAVVASLARTLGREGTALQCSSRVSACRRELNNHEAARHCLGSAKAMRRRLGTAEPHQAGIASSGAYPYTNDLEPQRQLELLHCVGASGFQSVRRAATASICAYAATAWWRLKTVARRGRQRGAGNERGGPPRVTGPCQARCPGSRRTLSDRGDR